MVRVCRYCGRALPVTHRANNAYCDDECRLAAAYRRRKGHFVPQLRGCGWCGRPFWTCSPSQKVCIPQHGWLLRQARRRLSRPPKPLNHAAKTTAYKPCRDCGIPKQTKLNVPPCFVLCDRCRVKRRRENEDRQGARRRGAKSAGERVVYEVVAKRDRWRCRICGGAVNPDTPRTEPTGGSLDHIIPVANGGPHIYSNIRLTHSACNKRRGTDGMLQLVLCA